MKKLSLFSIFIAVFFVTNAQKKSNPIHPLVLEYSKLADEYMKKNPQDISREEVGKMSTVSNQIECLLSLNQAKIVIPFFVENNMRNRLCGSDEYPQTEILDKASFNMYKTTIEKLTKKAQLGK